MKALRAVQLFSQGSHEEAVKIFLELDVNPAKVVALYPESVSGRLAKPKEEWLSLFGASGTKGIAGLSKTGSIEGGSTLGRSAQRPGEEPADGGAVPVTSSASGSQVGHERSPERQQSSDVVVRFDAPTSQGEGSGSVDLTQQYIDMFFYCSLCPRHFETEY